MSYNTPSHPSVNCKEEKIIRLKIEEIVHKISQRLENFARHHVPLNNQIVDLVGHLAQVKRSSLFFSPKNENPPLVPSTPIPSPKSKILTSISVVR